jgi:hypothetical protein
MAPTPDNPPPGAPPKPGGGFDRVGIPDANGSLKIVTKAEFENLPLGDRVKLLMSGTLHFYRGQERLSARDALRTG